MRIDYFDYPMQVMFYDIDDGVWRAGIAYRDEVICSCCGGIFEISDLWSDKPEDVLCPVWFYDEWMDIGEDIYGGEYPGDMIFTEPTLFDHKPEENRPHED